MTRYVQQRTISTRLIVEAHSIQGAAVARRDLGTFDKCEGLGLEAEDVKYAEYQVATGVRSREDATVRRPFTEASAEEMAFFDAACSVSAPITIIQNYNGDDGLPLGVPRTYTGAAKGVIPPEADSTGSERAEVGFVCIMNVDAN